MNLAQLVTTVTRQTEMFAHERTMLSAAAERYAKALGVRCARDCPAATYLLTADARTQLIETKCTSLPASRRRQVATLLDRLFVRAARLGLVDPSLAADALPPLPDKLAYPYVDEHGRLPDGCTIRDVESAIFVDIARLVMQRCRTQAEAARRLGLSKSAFQERLVRHGLYF